MTGNKLENKSYEVIVELDEFAESSRKWDNLGIIATWHKRYNLGDVQPDESPEEWFKNIEKEAYVILSVFMYEHSGIVISTEPFSCRFDSGQIGYIYTTKELLRNCFGRIPHKKRVVEALKQEIQIYSQDVSGDVYRYEVYELTTCSCCGVISKEVVDSCGGFYDFDGVKEQLGKYAQYWSGEVSYGR